MGPSPIGGNHFVLVKAAILVAPHAAISLQARYFATTLNPKKESK
jgi:hypothetical protein